MDLRDAIQRIALEFPCYGWRRVTVELRRRGRTVNHKRVRRIMREDNLLCVRKRIRRDSFFSVDDLVAAIKEFLAAWNEKPRPFVWTATVDSIVAQLARCRQTLEQIQPSCTLPKTRNGRSI